MISKKTRFLLEGLGRSVATRKPRQRFIVLCEGKNTEPQYFACLSRLVRNALVEIEIVGAVGTPHTIAKSAAARKQQAAASMDLSSFEKTDQYWAVFDRDEHPKFDEAVALCKQNSIGVARSNPCFELWLVLHIQDFDRPCHRKEIQRVLKKLHAPYNASKRKLADVETLISSIAAAESRAMKQCDRRTQEGGPFSAPSTTVGELTSSIRKAADLFTPTTKRKIRKRHNK